MTTLEPETKSRILDAAERLFGEQGVPGTSIRAVTVEARVNVAAVHYHFGSKAALLRALVARRVAPINRERLRLLNAVVRRSEAGEAPPIEEFVRAFLRPVFEGAQSDPDVRRVATILHSEPLEVVRPLLIDVFGEVATRFIAALGRALPQLQPDEVALRFQFAIGVMVHVVSGRAGIELRPGEWGPGPSDDALLREMVGFVTAGLLAPGAGPEPGSSAG